MATTSPRIVIIGAGVVGCALADQLTRRGYGRVTVLEQGVVFGGADAPVRAPGLLRLASSSHTMTRLAAASAATYAGLTDRDAPCLHRTGSVEVATGSDRLAELRRTHGRALAAGVDARMLAPGECGVLHPLVDESQVLGGLHVPGDGVADPVTVARAHARAAMRRGGVLLDRRRVTAVIRSGGRVTEIRCAAPGGAQEAHPADVVISCAGSRAPVVGELAGATIPVVPIVHQYATTDPLAALEVVHAMESAAGRPDHVLPVLRHPDAGLYVRALGHRLGLGGCGHHAVPVDPHEIGTTGPDAAGHFTPDEFEQAWESAAALLPALRRSKIADGADDVLPATPDGLPLLGEHPALAGFWTVEGVRFTHAAGVAEAVAEWITTGRPAVGGEPIDLSTADIGRFDPAALDPVVVRARARWVFETAREVAHPLDPPAVARPLRSTPFRSRQAELRAVFTEVDGVEQPLWYEANAGLPEVCEVTPRRGWEARNWSPVAGAEALVTRRAAGMTDLSAARRIEVTGPSSTEFLQRLVTGDVDGPTGQVLPTLMLDADGGIVAAPTVTRLAPSRFLVSLPDRRAVAALARYARPGVELTDATGRTACLGLWGPAVPDVLARLVPDEVHDLPRSTAAEFSVGGVAVTGLRGSTIGEDGWELVCAAADAERLWDTVHAAGARHGLVPVGLRALESLRLEAGERVPGLDLSPEHGPDASGLGERVAMGKGPFVGRAAVHAARAVGPPAEVLVTLVLDHDGAVLSGGEPVYDMPEARRFTRDPVPVDELPDGPPELIGRVTAVATGHSTGTSPAHAWVPADRAEPGTRVQVGPAGRRLSAQVVEDPVHVPSPTPPRVYRHHG